MKKLLLGIMVLVLAGAAQPGLGAQSQAQEPPTEAQLLERIAKQPNDAAAHIELAKLYNAQQRNAEAERMLFRALALLRTKLEPQLQAATNPYEGAVRVGGDIKEPIKIRDVKPIYPAEAQDAKVQGIVIVEALIGQDGSVREAKVLRSVPMLDDAALGAVRQWQFTPTLVNGDPVPVVMTVTVNFTLN